MAGQYFSGCGAGSPGFCAACPAGTYSLTPGNHCCYFKPDSCNIDIMSGCSTLAGASACSVCTASACIAGQYLRGCGGFASGVCAACPAGTYSLTPGNHCYFLTSLSLSMEMIMSGCFPWQEPLRALLALPQPASLVSTSVGVQKRLHASVHRVLQERTARPQATTAAAYRTVV
jgi:hypothetical protein